MAEFTLKDYRLRLILLDEWKSKTNIDETVKIVNEKLGENFVNCTKVQTWFDYFDNGKNMVFDQLSSLYISVQNNPIASSNSFLFLSNENQHDFNLLRCNDRFIEYLYGFHKKIIVRYDLLLNEKKEIETASNFRVFKMVNGFLLVSDYSRLRTLYLFKLDCKNSIINVLDAVNFNEWVNFIFADQLNPNKFVVFIHDDKFAMGEIQDEKIVLSELKNYDNIPFHNKRLLGSKLQWFDYNRESNSLKFCDIDLNTMERNELNVSGDLENDLSSVLNFKPDPYCWTGNRFYGMFKISNDQYHLLVFNLDELKWSHVKIMCSKPHNLFVDSNEVLTLKVGFHSSPYVYYRVNLRKPDKLKNLAQLAVSRQSTLFEKDKYLDVVRRLSI